MHQLIHGVLRKSLPQPWRLLVCSSASGLLAQGLEMLHLRLQRREEVVQSLLMSSRGHHTCTAPTPHRRWTHIQARSQSRESTHLKVQGCFH
jgi:hypothetical protein